MKDKCCGNCKHMENQDLDGFAWCERTTTETHCALSCDCYESMNGWAEITPDNVDELYESKERVCVAFVCNGEVSYMFGQFGMTLSKMAKYGGYYYYVLPELKKDETIT